MDSNFVLVKGRLLHDNVLKINVPNACDKYHKGDIHLELNEGLRVFSNINSSITYLLLILNCIHTIYSQYIVTQCKCLTKEKN